MICVSVYTFAYNMASIWYLFDFSRETGEKSINPTLLNENAIQCYRFNVSESFRQFTKPFAYCCKSIRTFAQCHSHVRSSGSIKSELVNIISHTDGCDPKADVQTIQFRYHQHYRKNWFFSTFFMETGLYEKLSLPEKHWLTKTWIS